MRLLFEMDLHDYADCTHNFVRNSARSIIIRHKKVAMIHSLKYDYYKFPGGIEGAESPVDAMIRETCEEAGLVVKPETVQEYGYVHRIQRSDSDRPNVLFRIIFTICAMLTMKSFPNISIITKRLNIMLWNLLILPLPFIRIAMYRIAHIIL